MRFTALLGLCFGALVGCATYHDDLERGQHYYEVSQFPNALAVWRTLEFDLDSLSYAEQARYSYLRGMTDYRMGFRADARHWLAVSRAIEQKHPGGLDAKSSSEMEKVLSELNAAVYAMGPPPNATATGMELKNVVPGVPANDVQTPVSPAAPAVSSVTAPTAPATAPTSAVAAAPAPAKAPPAALVPAAPTKAPPAAPVPAAPAKVPPAATAAPVPASPSVPPPSDVPPPSGF